MKDFGIVIISRAKVVCFTIMVMFIRAVGIRTNAREKVDIPMPTGLTTKENGRMTRNKVKELLCGPMAQTTRAIGLRTSVAEKEYFTMLTAMYTMEIGKTMYNMGAVYTVSRMEMCKKALL